MESMRSIMAFSALRSSRRVSAASICLRKSFRSTCRLGPGSTVTVVFSVFPLTVTATLYLPGRTSGPKVKKRVSAGAPVCGGSDIPPEPPQTGATAETRFFTLGPLVLPGKYNVAVTVNGKTEKTTVTVEPDPNLHVDLNDFRRQIDAALTLREDLKALNAMIERIDSMNQQLANFRHAADSEEGLREKYAPLLAQSRTLEGKLKSLKATVYNPNIQHNVSEDDIHDFTDFHDNLQQLATELAMRYDEPPNELIQARMTELANELQQHLAAFNSLLKTDIAAYNKAAVNAGAPTLFAGPPIAVQTAAAVSAGSQHGRQ